MTMNCWNDTTHCHISIKWVLSRNKKEQITDIYINMDDSQEHYAKWNEAYLEVQCWEKILHDISIHFVTAFVKDSPRMFAIQGP